MNENDDLGDLMRAAGVAKVSMRRPVNAQYTSENIGEAPEEVRVIVYGDLPAVARRLGL